MLGLFLLLSVSVARGYWTDIAPAWTVTGESNEGGLAFCRDQQWLVSYGTLLQSNGEYVAAAFMVDMNDNSTRTLCEGDCASGTRFMPIFVNIASSIPGTCNFLLYGGSDNPSTVDTRNTNDESVWLLQVNSTDHKLTQVTTTNESPGGRFFAGGIGVENHMIIAGGVMLTGKPTNLDDYLSDMWVFTLNGIFGEWRQVATNSQVFPSRYGFGSAYDADRRVWVMNGGMGITPRSDDRQYLTRQVIRSDVYELNVDQLLGATTPEAQIKIIGDSKLAQIDEDSSMFLKSHSIGVYQDKLFVYGGYALDASAASFRQLDQVLVTTNSVGKGSYECGLNGVLSSWCGFISQYPGNTVSPIATMGNSGQLYVMMPGLKLMQLDMKAVIESGVSELIVVEGVKQQLVDTATLQALQYSLVAVCCFFILSLVLLLRSRRHTMDIPNWSPFDKQTKVCTQEEIDALTVVSYNPESMAEVEGMHHDSDMCPICLVDFDADEELRILPCGHLFHGECLSPWLLKSTWCPMCKYDLKTGQVVAVQETEMVTIPLHEEDDIEAPTSMR